MEPSKSLLRASARPRGCRIAIMAFFATLLATSMGCATVAPYERERLAKKDMIVGEDGDLHAGEEHATAYREGSSGALGSSGGGCGCN